MKITIEIPDDCYGDYMDEDDNLIIVSPPVGEGQRGRRYWTGRLMNGNASELRWLI